MDAFSALDDRTFSAHVPLTVVQQSGCCTNLHAKVAPIAPTVGAMRYTQRYCTFPLTTAGERDRAGFIEAPQMGPANMASRAITDPMAIPAVIPFSFAPVETLKITSIRRNVSTTSRVKDCIAGPAGKVAPRVLFS